MLAMAEKILLLGVGLYLVALAAGENYTIYMHPKYRWLTTLAGLGLTMLALAAVWFKSASGRPFRSVIFGIFCLTILFYGVSPWNTAGDGAEPRFEVEEDYGPTVEMNGAVYDRGKHGRIVFSASRTARPRLLTGPGWSGAW